MFLQDEETTPVDGADDTMTPAMPHDDTAATTDDVAPEVTEVEEVKHEEEPAA
jgi:hypothetical protein